MGNAYRLLVLSNKEHAETFGSHFVPDLRVYYENLKKSENWCSCGGYSDDYENDFAQFLYTSKSGFLKFGFRQAGGLESLFNMIFYSNEKDTIREMAKDLGIESYEEKCVHGGS